jgi:hypothetical protein
MERVLFVDYGLIGTYTWASGARFNGSFINDKI